MPQPQSTRWNAAAHTLPPEERYCTCCERKLGAAFRYLEHDHRSQGYHDLRDVPEDKSQGWFPFGLTCARKLVADELKWRAKQSKESAVPNRHPSLLTEIDIARLCGGKV